MRRWGIRKKILVVTLVPTVLTTMLLGLFFTFSWVSDIERFLHDRGQSLSRQLSAAAEYGLFTANRTLLNSLSNALLEEPDVRSITFFDANQQRLVHSGSTVAPTLSGALFTSTHTHHQPIGGSTQFIVPVYLQDLMIDNMLELGGRSSRSEPLAPIGWVAVEMSHLRIEKETYKALLISLLLVLAGGLF